MRRWRLLSAACALALLLAVPIIATSGDGSGAVLSRFVADRVPVEPLAPAAAASGPRLLEAPGPAVPPAPPEPLTGLAAAAVQAAESAAAPATELAVAVHDRATGETAVGSRGTEPYYTASLSKVVVIVDMLDRRHLEGLAVSDADLDLVRRALGPSDDSAMNMLWTRFDGAGAAGRLSSRLGLEGTSAPRDPSQWGEMSVPAADTVRIWQHILDEMPDTDRELLISAMAAAPTVAGDGFDQAYGLLAPAVAGPEGPGAVAKQGWMCCFSGQYYLHSTGAVGAEQRFVVALLTRVPRGPGWEAARQELNAIATATVQALG
ncbi:serine hydrolase [Pseudonocardia nigra]|uniref:serine hydrolase n=1 Tax=Pseudonocardia nigra TaxID=1921578 RepID=UPI001C5E9D2C|nr:serine hydrolase [Pseudonocardia nigra]